MNCWDGPWGSLPVSVGPAFGHPGIGIVAEDRSLGPEPGVPESYRRTQSLDTSVPVPDLGTDPVSRRLEDTPGSRFALATGYGPGRRPPTGCVPASLAVSPLRNAPACRA